jgi:hypothetical protein
VKVGDMVRFRTGRKNALHLVMRLYRGGKGGNAPRVDIMYLFSGDRICGVRPSALEVINESR